MTGKNLRFSILSYFFIALLLDGLQRLSGLFVLELLQSRNISRQNASTPFILSWVVSNIIASFSASLIDNKISEHAILLGVLLSATGAALCVLATNITTLTVFWGLVFGSGHGLASPHLFNYLKNIYSSKLYFILQVTPSLGVAIMPFVLNVLNSYYGLQGSYLIFCGIILNYLPLALASTYNIKICIPNIKWRVRKKSKQYSISKQDGSKTASIESFTNSLEPDLIVEMSNNDESLEETTKNESDFFPDVVLFPIGRKRSETRGNDLQGLEMGKRIFPRNKTPSQVFVEIKNYENGRDVFEKSFRHKDIVHDGMQCTDTKSNCDINHSMNILNTKMGSHMDFKDKILHKIPESENDEVISQNKIITNSLEKDAENKTVSTHTCVESKNTVLQNIDSNKDSNVAQKVEKCENEKGISSPKAQKEDLDHSSSKKSQPTKPLAQKKLQLSSQHLQNEPAFNLPLDIKVHVEECVFKTDDEDWEESFNNRYLKARKNSNRNYSNSIVLGMRKSIDFSTQNSSKNFSQCSKLHTTKLSNIYSISAKSELGIIAEGGNRKEKKNDTMAKQIVDSLNEISSRICLCILLINIIFEINLVTLLTMFADFGNDVYATADFKWILVAFGIGGIMGKFCCCKISKTIPEKCHAIGVVLFLLTGLSTAGVLYSSSLNWLASFYCILGALEGGITYIIPKFILEFVDENAHFTLSSMKSFLSGVALTCIPYAIGFFRDEMGDYEFLLQILSCSSILCAFLAYFLPYLRTTSNKQIHPSFLQK